jgi:hypothetical protein
MTARQCARGGRSKELAAARVVVLGQSGADGGAAVFGWSRAEVGDDQRARRGELGVRGRERAGGGGLCWRLAKVDQDEDGQGRL